MKINQKGFTIIELMIATAVLSTILVMVTVLMTNIGTLYYKGINQSRVQDNVRAITDEIAQQLQLSTDGFVVGTWAAPAPAGAQSICIGTIRYSYIVDKQIGVDTPHVFYRDRVSSGCTVANLSDPALSGGVELIAPNSRLTSFSVSPDSPYNISIGVVYGDNEYTMGSGADRKCKGGAGNQFCAKAELTTLVGKRL